jgi:hypothetical protein
MKEEQRAVICFFWSEGVSHAKIHRRMSVQYRNSIVLEQMNGSRCSRMVIQALSMRKELDVHPHPLLMQTWNESMT